MINTEIIHIILIATFSLGVAIFQYFYNVKQTGGKRYILAILRFLSIFLLCLLLVNPVFKKTKVVDIKPNLVVLIDNSESITFSEKINQVNGFIKDLKNSSISKKFNIDFYSFGESFKKINGSLNFSEKQTNISEVFTSLKDLYSTTNSPTLLLSDGNQTFGNDYVLSSKTYKQPIFPVVLGDSVLKKDISILKIQHNKYSFLGNDYPVEITINYLGSTEVSKELNIYSGNKKVFSKTIKLSKENQTTVVDFLLKAKYVGKIKYTAEISTLNNELNILNNKRDFSIDVINERTNVLLISDILHPDIGCIKKAIESNEHRNVDIVKPDTYIDFNKYQLFILYQPNYNFKSIYQQIDSYKKNFLTVTGLHTDLDFINSVSINFNVNYLNTKQEYTATLNNNFNLFQTEKLDYSSFPPLLGFYSDINLKKSNGTLLHKKINNIITTKPLLSFFENENRREAVLLGEGIWKWRAKSYINNKSFEKFDQFLGKTIQYLSSNNKKERLLVNSAKEYFLAEAKLTVQYFDKNYQSNSNEIIWAKLINDVSKEEIDLQFLFDENEYILDLKHLKVGDYTYVIKTTTDNLIKRGSFELIDFNIESQFVNPDVTKLSQIATNSKTDLFYITEYSKLFKNLQTNNKFKSTQRSQIINVPLIEWYYMLWCLIFVLGIEWFLRKYNGLI